jgi:hypothetical protein
MKKTILTLLSVLFCAITFAQNVPQGINYQAIARDAAGAELANDTLIVQFSVLEGAAISWQEIDTVTTNEFGLFTTIIGGGTSTSNGSSSTFDLVDWGAAAHSLKVEIDYGNGYLDMGTTDFMSVPYSLHAKTAANGSTTDELQTLTISGDTIFLVGGGLDSNFIVLPSGSNNPVLDSLTLVYDDNFENYLENNGMGDGIMLNNYVLTSNIQNVTNLDISGLGIMDFFGIENFISLQELRCQNNAGWGQFGPIGTGSLYLPNASNLTYLDCSSNEMPSLHITNSPDLQFLYCQGNSLLNLSLANFSLLEKLNCASNNISSLNISNSVGLTELSAYFNNLTSIDISTNTLLIDLNLGYNDLTSIDISTNTLLTDLNVGGNDLTSIDISTNTLLTDLYLGGNDLTSIDLSQNTALLSLNINYNELITLDLSHNTSLSSFQSGYAPYLTQIDIRNGNNVTMNSYQAFYTSNSPNLACVSVDDPIWSNNNTNWRNSNSYHGADPWTLFSADCNAIYGCTDSTATNYNAAANTDDGSCIAVVNGCTDSTATNYNPLANIDDGTCTYPFSGTIGDTLMGGIVFYIFQAGDIGYVAGQVHGLIAAPSDHSTSASWGCDGFLIGATATAIGTGQSNTSTIQAWCSVSSAGQICGNLTLGGNSDWFLPSRDELNKMYVNLHQQNLGSFTNDIYWSSSEYAGYLALYHNFASGYQGDTYKDEHYKVRAVRAF